MSKLLEQLGINEERIIGNNYAIRVIRESDDELIGFVDFKDDDALSIEYCRSKLYVDGDERELTYLSDAIIAKSVNYDEKIKFIEENKYLNIYIDDKDYEVRVAVAEQGYGLDKLVDDPHFLVRLAVAKQGYGLEKLVNDESGDVRLEVANQNYGLDILVNDPAWFVRVAVADKGYGLDILINDKRKYVEDHVNKWLNDHYITIEEYIQNKGYWYAKALEK